MKAKAKAKGSATMKAEPKPEHNELKKLEETKRLKKAASEAVEAARDDLVASISACMERHPNILTEHTIRKLVIRATNEILLEDPLFARFLADLADDEPAVDSRG